jgi:hypothetical protein
LKDAQPAPEWLLAKPLPKGTRKCEGKVMSATNEEAIYLSPEALQAAEQIRDLANLKTVEDAIRIALGDELYLQQQIANGASVVLKTKDKFWELDWKARR